MNIQPTLAVPEAILRGLHEGAYRLRGGVVQWATGTPDAGQVVAWLREAGTEPVSTSTVMRAALGLAGGASPLGWINAGASVLNLAATVGFGVALLLRLNKVDKRIGSLKDSIDEGFRGVEALLHAVMEGDFQARLRAAAIYCVEVQLENLSVSNRQDRLVKALQMATEAFTLRQAHTQAALQSAENWLTNATPAERVTNPEPVLLATTQLRQAVMACALRASVTAEVDGPDIAASFVTDQLSQLQNLGRDIGSLYLRRSGSPTEEETLDDVHRLILDYRGQELSLPRLGAWFDRCKIKGGLPDILERYRSYNASRMENSMEPIRKSAAPWWSNLVIIDLLGIWARVSSARVKTRVSELLEDEAKNRKLADSLTRFADQFDGAWDDLDRLEGHCVEYTCAANAKLSMADWNRRLASSASKRTDNGFVLIGEPSSA